MEKRVVLLIPNGLKLHFGLMLADTSWPEGGEGGGKGVGRKKKGENSGRLQPCACCHLEVGKGLKEKEEDGVRTSQGRSADQAEKKREKKKKSGNPFKIWEQEYVVRLCNGIGSPHGLVLWYVKWSYNSPFTENLASVCDTAAITNGGGGRRGINQGKVRRHPKKKSEIKSTVGGHRQWAKKHNPAPTRKHSPHSRASPSGLKRTRLCERNVVTLKCKMLSSDGSK